MTVKAAEGVNRILIADEPERYFFPSYVGSKRWVGIRLSNATEWDESVTSSSTATA